MWTSKKTWPPQPLWPQKCKRFSYWVVFLPSAALTASFCWIDHYKSIFSMIFGTLPFRGCGGQPLALVSNIRVKSQMPIDPEHAIKEKPTKLLILLPLRTLYNRTCQCETPCMRWILFLWIFFTNFQLNIIFNIQTSTYSIPYLVAVFLRQSDWSEYSLKFVKTDLKFVVGPVEQLI